MDPLGKETVRILPGWKVGTYTCIEAQSLSRLSVSLFLVKFMVFMGVSHHSKLYGCKSECALERVSCVPSLSEFRFTDYPSRSLTILQELQPQQGRRTAGTALQLQLAATAGLNS